MLCVCLCLFFPPLGKCLYFSSGSEKGLYFGDKPEPLSSKVLFQWDLDTVLPFLPFTAFLPAIFSLFHPFLFSFPTFFFLSSLFSRFIIILPFWNVYSLSVSDFVLKKLEWFLPFYFVVKHLEVLRGHSWLGDHMECPCVIPYPTPTLPQPASLALCKASTLSVVPSLCLSVIFLFVISKDLKDLLEGTSSGSWTLLSLKNWADGVPLVGICCPFFPPPRE